MNQFTIQQLIEYLESLDQNTTMTQTFTWIEASREDYSEMCFTVTWKVCFVHQNLQFVKDAIGHELYGKNTEPTIVTEKTLTRVGDWSTGSEPINQEYIDSLLQCN